MRTHICFLLCFAKPIGNLASPTGWAQHYLGSSTDLEAELARFARNGGHASIMQELARQGIGFDLVRTWPGGRLTERWLKNKHSPVRLCPRCWPVKGSWQVEDAMYGGYAAVAAVLNQRFGPQPPVSRSRVYHWHIRQSRNHLGQVPPAPVEEHPEHKRTQPRFVFDTADWVAWFEPGVPGRNGKGWVRYVDRLAS